MKLSMLYSVYGDGICDLYKRLPRKSRCVEIIIVHQSTSYEGYNKDIYELKARKDVIYIQQKEKGVTKSRNLAISHASGDVVLFCDDDITYYDEYLSLINSAYSYYPNADFITFAYSSDGARNEKFTDTTKKHSLLSILRVGTIEVTCKLSVVKSFNISFPEDMGAGSKYFLCDEPVFLSKFIKRGLKGYYVPSVLCDHPENSSGSIFNSSDAFSSRLICFKRIFGSFSGILLYLIFLFKNLKKFDSFYSLKIALSKIFSKIK